MAKLPADTVAPSQTFESLMQMIARGAAEDGCAGDDGGNGDRGASPARVEFADRDSLRSAALAAELAKVRLGYLHFMTNRLWRPGREVAVPYEPIQHDLYRAGDPACRFHAVRWPLSGGRAKFGEFPLVVAREHFRKLGYTVLASEPRLPGRRGFILVSYPGKRRAGDPAYRRMERVFGDEVLAELNERADLAKRKLTGNRGGGDPDLFAFRPGDPADRFFLEVKHYDQIIKKQRVAFHFIEELCPIIVARLIPVSPLGLKRDGRNRSAHFL